MTYDQWKRDRLGLYACACWQTMAALDTRHPTWARDWQRWLWGNYGDLDYVAPGSANS